jgi:LemA protein
MKKGCMICIGICAAVIIVLVVIIGSFIGKYNSMQKLKIDVDNAWAEVENQFQRRFDLIPNIVETVKGYANHEAEIFSNIAESRAKIGSASSNNEKMSAYNGMESAISRLLVIAENYPDLKANSNFIKLQDELSGTENRLAVARMRYNEAVGNLNKSIIVFPNNVIAGIFNIEKGVFFEAPTESRTVPKVNF